MKDNELDNLFREALQNLDGAPPQAENWNKESTFNRIQFGLNGDQNQSKHNFFDLAAAVVLTITAITYLFSFFVAPKIQESLPELITSVSSDLINTPGSEENSNEVLLANKEKSDNEVDVENEINLGNTFYYDQTMESKTVAANLNDEFLQKDLFKRNTIIPTIEPIEEEKRERNAVVDFQLPFGKKTEVLQAHSNKLELSLPVGVAYSAGTVAPVASFNATLNLNKHKATTSQLSVGLSAYGLLEKSEEKSIGIEPVLFAETSFGIESNNDNFVSGHSVGLGYQLNEVDAIEGNAIKLNYTISIKKRLRVAAEALVSEGMSRIQPGIKLTFI